MTRFWLSDIADVSVIPAEVDYQLLTTQGVSSLRTVTHILNHFHLPFLTLPLTLLALLSLLSQQLDQRRRNPLFSQIGPILMYRIIDCSHGSAQEPC